MAWEDEFSPYSVLYRIQDLCEDPVDEIELYLHEFDHANWWLQKDRCTGRSGASIYFPYHEHYINQDRYLARIQFNIIYLLLRNRLL